MSLPDGAWRQAFATRGLLTRQIEKQIRAANGDRVVLSAPPHQPHRRMFAQKVNAVAWRVFGPGGYRLESLDDPPRISVWRDASLLGIPRVPGMSRRAVASVRAYFERRL